MNNNLCKSIKKDDKNTTFSMIWAQGVNGEIGKNGIMPWHIKEDLEYFKTVTQNKTVIMGATTWNSLFINPLPNRLNIVISSGKTKLKGLENLNKVGPNSYSKGNDSKVALIVAKTPLHAMGYAGNEAIIIGGSSIYEVFLPVASKLYITKIDTKIEDADTFAPFLDLRKWTLEKRTPEKGFYTENKIAFEVYTNKDN